MAGLGGALYAHFMRFISASDFAFPLSVSLLSMVVVGGIGTLWGRSSARSSSGAAEVFRPLTDYRILFYTMLPPADDPLPAGGLLGENSAARRVFAKNAAGEKTMNRPLLEISGLSKHFGGLRAVDGVSFQIRTGEILGLLGPNGAGKTVCFQPRLRRLQTHGGADSLRRAAR